MNVINRCTQPQAGRSPTNSCRSNKPDLSAQFDARERRQDVYVGLHRGASAASAVAAAVYAGPVIDELVRTSAGPWAGLIASGVAGGILGWALSSATKADGQRTMINSVVGVTMGAIGGAVAGGNGLGTLASYSATAVAGGSTSFLAGNAVLHWVTERSASKLDGPAFATWAAGKEASHDFRPGEASLVGRHLTGFINALKNDQGQLDATAATKIRNLTEDYLAAHGHQPAKVNALLEGIAEAAGNGELDPQSTGLTMGAVLAALASSDRRNYSTFASIGSDFLSAIPGFSQAGVLVAGMKAALKLLGSKKTGSDKGKTAGILKSEVQLAWGRALEARELKKREFSLLTNGMDAGLAANGFL